MPQNRYLNHELTSAAAIRLIALPYAGGGTALFHRWRPMLPAGVDLVPVSLPGREARINEPAIAEMGTLVRAIADELAPAIDRPFVFVGHSLGALIAFELARELRRREARMPCLLVAAASAPPHRPRASEAIHKLPNDEFVAELEQRFGGMPRAIRENQELLAFVMPTLRADIELLETYEYAEERPLETDLLTMGGSEDRAVSTSQISDWRRHTAKRFTSRMFAGGHFFLFPGGEHGSDESLSAVRTIAQQIERYRDASGGAISCS